MKIAGFIKNKRTQEPLAQTRIVLSIGTTEIAGFFSDGKGHYEYEVSKEYENQILCCRFEKDGYKSTEVEQELKEEKITLNIQLEKELIQIRGITRNKKDKLPLDQTTISFQVDSESFSPAISDNQGKFTISLPSKYKDQELKYEAKKQEWLPAQGTIPIGEDTPFDIELEKEIIQEKKESGREKIKLTMRVRDEKGKPLHKVLIILDSEEKHLGNYFTDKNGLIEFVLNPDFENKTVKYTESFEGFEEVAGEIRLKNETFHEITIKRLPPIDFWLGLKEKRWLYTKGSIFLLLFVTIFIYYFKKEEASLIIGLAIISLYTLISCSLLKGYLLPITNSIIASLGLFICLFYASRMSGIKDQSSQFFIYFIYLPLGLISTFVARKSAKKKKKRNIRREEEQKNKFGKGVKDAGKQMDKFDLLLQHPDFQVLMKYTPSIRKSKLTIFFLLLFCFLFIGVCISMLLPARIGRNSVSPPIPFVIVCIFMIIFAVIVIGSMIFRWLRLKAAPLQRIPALIIGKRMEVSSGEYTHYSHYYVTLQFRNSERKEFSAEGKLYGLIADGDLGVGYIKKTLLVDFRPLSV